MIHTVPRPGTTSKVRSALRNVFGGFLREEDPLWAARQPETVGTNRCPKRSSLGMIGYTRLFEKLGTWVPGATDRRAKVIA